MRSLALSRFLLPLVLLCGTSVLPADDDSVPVYFTNPPALTPDGSAVVFSHAGDLWRMPTTGGRAIRITTHPAREGAPLFSPDGKSLAFASNRTGSTQTFVMDADGSAPRQVTFHSEGSTPEDWETDGDAMLISGSRDHFWRHTTRFFRIPVGERSAEELLFDAYGSEPDLSPDGTKVLFVREGERWWRKGYVGSRDPQLWMHDRETNEFTKLLSPKGGARSPIWQPDGKGFYYVGAEDGSFDLRHYDLATKKTRALTGFDDDSVLFPTLSQDGSTLAFRHLFDLYTLSTKPNSKPKRLTIELGGDSVTQEMVRRSVTRADNATLTKDGLEIAFAGGGDLWVMDTELKEPVPITSTAQEEREPIFVDDGKAILFLRDHDGQVDLYQATRGDDEKFWWRNTEFNITRLTNTPETESNVTLSPDGKHLAFVRGRGHLWLADRKGTPIRQITDGFSLSNYVFSPDGKWIAYAAQDDDFNSDIWIVPVDGSQPATNVSRHPDNDYSPAFSSDGRILAFTGRRNADESDIYYVFLRKEDDETGSRDRRLKKALEKIQKVRKTAPTPKPTPEPTLEKPKPEPEKKADKPAEQKKPEATEKPAAKETPTEKKPEANKSNLPKVIVDLDGIHDRVRRISIPEAYESGLFWFGDGKTLAFTSRIDGDSGTYTVEIPDRLSARRLTSTTGSFLGNLKDGKQVAFLTGGRPGTLSLTGGKVTTYSVSALQAMKATERHEAAFNVAWRLMRDNWYDDRFGNRNWDQIRRKYEPAAAAAPDPQSLDIVVDMMLGELNGSHLGFTAYGGSRPDVGWQPTTAHLGVRFDPEFKGPGLKVRDVLPDGPATEEDSRIEPGEIIVSIDGTPVDPNRDLTAILNGPLSRDLTLVVKNAKGTTRTVMLRPISFGLARELVYRHWLAQNRRKVEKMSKGKLGYLHIRSMNQSSFLEFERQLFDVGYGREGLVIDVRENGGGFTTDHLLTALTQPRHAITVPRGGGEGYPHDRKIYATWDRPIIVLCNQNSFSNAEIFSHAIKGLKRGKVVGVTTAGGVISTGGARVMDMGYLRQPFRGWYVLWTGEDMELNGAQPHFEIWPEPGDWPSGTDEQLKKAVQVLKKEVKKVRKQPRIKLRNATER